MTRRVVSALCIGLAWVLLAGGLVAGVVNRQVLDGSQFASHVDAVRRDPAVSRQIGEAITTRALAASPDLVALRPLVEATSIALVGSPAFSPVVRAAARQAHASFTEAGPGPVVWRLVDVGAVLSGMLPLLVPQTAAPIPPDLSVTLASVGSRSFAARTIHLAHLVGLLAWLLPLLALLAFAGALLAASDRLRATVRVGWAVLGAGVAVGMLAFAGELVASAADTSTLHGSLVAASWRQFGRPLWAVAAVTAVSGVLVAATAAGAVPRVDLSAGATRAWAAITQAPDRKWHAIGRGVTLVAAGLGALLRPQLVFGVVGGSIGLIVLVAGAAEIAAAAGVSRRLPRPERPGRPSRPLRVKIVASMTAVALVGGLVAFDSAPASRQVPIAAATGKGCNGYVQLCERPYNDVAFVATHNAMSAADEPGWFIPEQPTGLIGQLDSGVRVLLIDTWYGQTTTTPGLIVTAPGSHDAALAEAERLFGAAAVTSALRLRDALSPTPTGPVMAYLCHGLCEIGATEWQPAMAEVRSWLDAHPREVVTFFIEDYVSPADTATVFRQAGLLRDVYTPQPGKPWPTLGQMIASGHRVVVLMENNGGAKADPWLQQGFDVAQDTPFNNPTVASLNCGLNRGSATNPLFLVNYWLSGFQSLVSNARRINAYDVLWPYLQRCQAERQHLPNFVAVNFYNEGDVFRAVDQLNGLAPP
ncbi:MAG TPA: hypothetical protein VFZ97_12985 [Acidimicrobiales bacterium]